MAARVIRTYRSIAGLAVCLLTACKGADSANDPHVVAELRTQAPASLTAAGVPGAIGTTRPIGPAGSAERAGPSGNVNFFETPWAIDATGRAVVCLQLSRPPRNLMSPQIPQALWCNR